MIVFGTDLDGTLYFHDGRKVRDIDVEAIERFQKEGNLFGLVSGRGPSMREELYDMIDHKVHFDFRIFANGTAIFLDGDEPVKETFLDPKIVHEVTEEAIRDNVNLTFHCPHDICRFKFPEDIDRIREFVKEEIPVYEISFRYHDEAGDNFWKKVKECKEFHVAKNDSFADINPLNSSKGIALNLAASLLAKDGQEVHTAAIGDSYNDLPMITQAEDGFTFHASDQAVKDQADHVVDGIWEAVEFLENKYHH